MKVKIWILEYPLCSPFLSYSPAQDNMDAFCANCEITLELLGIDLGAKLCFFAHQNEDCWKGLCTKTRQFHEVLVENSASPAIHVSLSYVSVFLVSSVALQVISGICVRSVTEDQITTETAEGLIIQLLLPNTFYGTKEASK